MESAACEVSILTRPEGRVLRRSTPVGVAAGSCFNPHPARRPSATHGTTRTSSPTPVSILTRPEGRVLRGERQAVVVREAVSILTRPEGRVLPGATTTPSAGSMFQSSPGPKAECYQEEDQQRVAVLGVSILTRPEGRVLRPCPRRSRAGCRGFNPHPARRPSATSPKARRPNWIARGFNPHPARRPSATCSTFAPARTLVPFQSSPGPKAECYTQPAAALQGALAVSILTRPEGRVLQPLPADARVGDPVSILTRPEGRVLPGRRGRRRR